ncbi:MAG: twin-arginine translocase subunit TatB [Candidatus Abyssobacteria bacterium SURF_5]|uniref:Twin-arginine translocase subunit TatB n=1 Tax=Abyssobacteria bacterium (strain SURF_5) TaxID=2093360 RepID=A0A3A4N671_ABYX5|nr:MAG: twin-arginine translocase subunit TatB [Candidatus Abyssubacteria bacterium SURF_5]
MIGIGPVELLVILIVALIVFGPERMPELARNLAKLVRDLRGAMDEVREQFNELTKEDLLPTKEIDAYYRETIDSVKKSIEPPPDMPDIKDINAEVEQSIRQIDNPPPDKSEQQT